MTLELTLAPSGAAVATPRHPLAPHFFSGALSNSASGFTRTLAVDGHLSQGRCRYKAPASKFEGGTHLVIKETGQSDQENLKDTGFEEADLVLKQMKVKTSFSRCKNILTS